MRIGKANKLDQEKIKKKKKSRQGKFICDYFQQKYTKKILRIKFSSVPGIYKNDCYF